MARTKTWRDYPEDTERKRWAHIQRKYGLSQEEWYELLLTQGGHCKICDTLMSKPMVDHCHKTGAVRGLLCYHCNVALGHFRDDPEVLRKAASYLEAYQDKE